jgi:two-component system, cell cycle sensor histidine kinase and response regulator CckA
LKNGDLEAEVARLRAVIAELEDEAIELNLRSIAEQIPDNIMVLDTEERIRFINWTVPDLDHERVLGTRPYEHLPESERDRVRRIYRKVLATGEPERANMEYQAADGSRLYWETRVVPHRRRGRIDGLIVISTNVTERVNLEMRLRQAQKMEAIGQLAGGVAHDFNNLLLTILGNADFARRSGIDAQAGGYLDEIVHASHRAAGLTRQLLALSGKRPMRVAPVDLNELVRELVQMMRRTIPETIAIELVLDERLPLAWADASQIEQVLLNLCLNARDAMPGGGRLTLRSEAVSLSLLRRGSHALLSVSDTGSGIAPEIRERVFEPFFTTKSHGEGTGLGLFSAYGIVESHGGMLDFVTDAGSGTTFKVYLPLGPLTARREEDRRTEPARGGHETILVAEDADAVRGLLVRVLEHAGYDVVTAGDGAAAVERARERGDIRLALLDMVMPRMSGPDAEIEIRKTLPGLPVLFTTGYSDGGYTNGAAHGARIPKSRIIQKPYAPDDLLRRVRRELDATAALASS